MAERLQRPRRRFDMRLATTAALTATLVLSGTLSAAAQAPKLVGEFRDWQVHENKGQPANICFAISQPKETQPRNISRKTAYFYVSAWPRDGVKAEVSLKLGFQAPDDSNVVVRIGRRQFQLFAKGDKAFVADPRDELKLIDAMKSGSFMTVTASTSAGARVKDTYSLMGVTQAIGAIDSCN
ncbi:MAG: invasion associated locus B family protein [Pseudomonadota bacterium]